MPNDSGFLWVIPDLILLIGHMLALAVARTKGYLHRLVVEMKVTKSMPFNLKNLLAVRSAPELETGLFKLFLGFALRENPESTPESCRRILL